MQECQSLEVVTWCHGWCGSVEQWNVVDLLVDLWEEDDNGLFQLVTGDGPQCSPAQQQEGNP